MIACAASGLLIMSACVMGRRLEHACAASELSVGESSLDIENFGRTAPMASSQKSQPRHAPDGALFDDLYDYVAMPARPGRRRAKRASETLTVTDDWPEDLPVTEA